MTKPERSDDVELEKNLTQAILAHVYTFENCDGSITLHIKRGKVASIEQRRFTNLATTGKAVA